MNSNIYGKCGKARNPLEKKLQFKNCSNKVSNNTSINKTCLSTTINQGKSNQSYINHNIDTKQSQNQAQLPQTSNQQINQDQLKCSSFAENTLNNEIQSQVKSKLTYKSLLDCIFDYYSQERQLIVKNKQIVQKIQYQQKYITDLIKQNSSGEESVDLDQTLQAAQLSKSKSTSKTQLQDSQAQTLKLNKSSDQLLHSISLYKSRQKSRKQKDSERQENEVNELNNSLKQFHIVQDLNMKRSQLYCNFFSKNGKKCDRSKQVYQQIKTSIQNKLLSKQQPPKKETVIQQQKECQNIQDTIFNYKSHIIIQQYKNLCLKKVLESKMFRIQVLDEMKKCGCEAFLQSDMNQNLE